VVIFIPDFTAKLLIMASVKAVGGSLSVSMIQFIDTKDSKDD